MKSLLLIAGALSSAAAACEKSEVCHLGQALTHIIASFQADKAPAKQPAPAPSEPAKKPAPKERDSRPNPPGHLFM